jgi:hypothetical protein
MNISLDYDHTYTVDPTFWFHFINSCHIRGHTVYMVTARHGHEMEDIYKTVGKILGEGNIFFTSFTPKRKFMRDKGIEIDVWIDDTPEMIIGEGDSIEGLSEYKPMPDLVP